MNRSIFFFLFLTQLSLPGITQAYKISFIQDNDFEMFKNGCSVDLDSNLIFQISDQNTNGFFFDSGIDGICIMDNIHHSKSVASLKDSMIFNYREKSYKINIIPPFLSVSLTNEGTAAAIDLLDTLPAFSFFEFNSEKQMQINKDIYTEYNYVYVSVWASYCSPCVEEMPYFRTFYNQYNKKILFIHLCLSDDEKNARKILGTNNPPGIQGSCSKETLRLLNADFGFPRGNLYDSTGKLIQAFYHVEDMFNFISQK